MKYAYKLTLTSILVIIFSSCYAQRKKLDCVISELNKLQNDFFKKNKCDENSDSQLLYFARKERKDIMNILQKKFPELKYTDKHQDIFLIESNNIVGASFFNYLIVNDYVYTYHSLYHSLQLEKIPILEFTLDSLENYVIIDILKNKKNWVINLPEKGTRLVLGGSCFFVTQITWNTKKPNFKMALFEEYSSFR